MSHHAHSPGPNQRKIVDSPRVRTPVERAVNLPARSRPARANAWTDTVGSFCDPSSCEDFLHCHQGRAERAARKVAHDPARGSACWRTRLQAGALGGAGAMRSAGNSPHPGWQLRLRTCGARRAAAPALPWAPPVTGWPPSRPPTPLRGNGHPPRRSSLQPRKITVKCGASGAVTA
jgi:hypothetical protein